MWHFHSLSNFSMLFTQTQINSMLRGRKKETHLWLPRRSFFSNHKRSSMHIEHILSTVNYFIFLDNAKTNTFSISLMIINFKTQHNNLLLLANNGNLEQSIFIHSKFIEKMHMFMPIFSLHWTEMPRKKKR